MPTSLPVPGSIRNTLAAHHATKLEQSVPCDQQIHVAVVLKAEASAHTYDAVERFAKDHDLAVLERHEGKHNVVLAGTIENAQKAFSVELLAYQDKAGKQFHARTGAVYVPTELHDSVLAVLGLDNRPVAKPHFRKRTAAGVPHVPGGPKPLTAVEVAKLYDFPSDATGKEQTIAMIELGGGYDQRDLETYFKKLSIKTPDVQAVSVQGCTNTTGSDADGEVALDIQVAGAIAPDAKILVYFCPNTDQGFLAAINAAIHDSNKCGIVSISWGSPEDCWTEMSLRAFNQAFETAAQMGVTVTVAAGDNGSSDGETGETIVDFPASSPFVTACGGTRLTGNGSKIASETVWNDGTQGGATGGGISSFFPLPDYQQKSTGASGQYRNVPDVAGNADPDTGYPIVVAGDVSVTGGTSAIAPLLAGLTALLNEKRRKNLGFLNPVLYTNPTCFRDVTSGSNGCYNAVKGFDCCTGLGSPNGTAIEKVTAK